MNALWPNNLIIYNFFQFYEIYYNLTYLYFLSFFAKLHARQNLFKYKKGKSRNDNICILLFVLLAIVLSSIYGFWLPLWYLQTLLVRQQFQKLIKTIKFDETYTLTFLSVRDLYRSSAEHRNSCLSVNFFVWILTPTLSFFGDITILFISSLALFWKKICYRYYYNLFFLHDLKKKLAIMRLYLLVTWLYSFPLIFLWFIYQNVSNS